MARFFLATMAFLCVAGAFASIVTGAVTNDMQLGGIAAFSFLLKAFLFTRHFNTAVQRGG